MAQLPPELTAQMFADHGLLDDTNEAKRRRIARVRLKFGPRFEMQRKMANA